MTTATETTKVKDKSRKMGVMLRNVEGLIQTAEAWRDCITEEDGDVGGADIIVNLNLAIGHLKNSRFRINEAIVCMKDGE